MKRQNITDALRVLLETLPYGARLPPERALAATFNCSRATLRAALDTLESTGELWRHVGQGTFCGTRPKTLPFRQTQPITAADLMQARLIIEPAIAAAAACCGPHPDLAAKAAAGTHAHTRASAEAADESFHRALAEATGNPVLIGLMTYLSTARRRAAWQAEWDTLYRRLGLAEFQRTHTAQHKAIVAAITERDPAAASAAMQTHLATIQSAMTTAR